MTSPMIAAVSPAALRALSGRGGAVGGHGGEKAAGGLRVEEQIGARAPRGRVSAASEGGAVRGREGGGAAGAGQGLGPGQERQCREVEPGGARREASQHLQTGARQGRSR